MPGKGSQNPVNWSVYGPGSCTNGVTRTISALPGNRNPVAQPTSWSLYSVPRHGRYHGMARGIQAWCDNGCRDRGQDKRNTVHRGIGILELRPVNNIRLCRLGRANIAGLLRGLKFKCYNGQQIIWNINKGQGHFEKWNNLNIWFQIKRAIQNIWYL